MNSRTRNLAYNYDTLIGAGSVVTHDIPSGVIAAGNPCRVLRTITEKDKIGYKGSNSR